jgi:UDP-2,4-diacetamido-2,4,6-trideoxy-beta-L-altropyranose hydrolase
VADALAVFRCDASPILGAGHVMRCLAFADVLRWAGWSTEFLVSPPTTATVPALARAGVGVRPAHGNDNTPDARLVVVDHYALDAGDERLLAPRDAMIVALDDLADRSHACDVLVDPTPDRVPAAYARLVPPTCRLMLGASHALVRASWSARREAALSRRSAMGGVERILVSMGATDAVDATGRALDALDAANVNAAIDVVLGTAAPHRERIAARLRPGQRLHVDPTDLEDLVSTADLAIGAPGSSSFERAILGLPSILVPIADNQRFIAGAFAARGAALVLPRTLLDEPSELGARIAALIRSAEQRLAMSHAASAITDGRGTRRLLAASAGERRVRDGMAIRLRLAESDDEAWLLELQRQPETRRYARNRDIPDAASHGAWLARALADADRLLCIVEGRDEPHGMVRLDRIAGPATQFEVSIAIDSAARGRGVGTASLALLRRLAPGAALLAEIHPDNAVSQALFARVGYRRESETRWRSLP